jgi:hypothetical protein
MWNYRVVKTFKKDGSIRVAVHEAYNGGIGWTENPAAPEIYVEDDIDPISSLKFILEGMILSLDRPVIEDTSELENT